jgi:hypothetical protein
MILAEPELLQYPYAESLRSLARFCDRIIINFAAGTRPGVRQMERASLQKISDISQKYEQCTIEVMLDESWPEQRNLTYEDLRIRFQHALDKCKSGWFLRFDGDNVFSHSAADAVKKKLTEMSERCHIAYFPRVDVINRENFYVNSGSRDLYALNVDLLNRDQLGYRISRNKRAWCRAEIDGSPVIDVISDTSMMPINYDATFFTRARIVDFWRKTCETYRNAGLESTDVDSMSDDDIIRHYKAYILHKRRRTDRTFTHPEDIRDRVSRMTPDHWGFDNFGGLS